MTSESQEKKKANSREVAFSILYRVVHDGAYSNLLLDRELTVKNFSRQDGALVTQLVYGVLRQQGTLDYILEQFLTRPLRKLPVKILVILRLGVYQLYYMDKIPAAAAVNESVKLARKHGHEGTARLVNGVLRKVSANKEHLQWPSQSTDLAHYIAVTESHPLFLVERWLKELGEEETLALCHYNNQPAPLTLRINTLKATKEEVIATLTEKGVEVAESRWAKDALVVHNLHALASCSLFKEGKIVPQDESSQLAVLNLAPSPGAKVIDMCAAPGGKATYMAQLMRNRGEIKAFDIHNHKIELLKEARQRTGATIVEPAIGNGTIFQPELENWADYVLVDAPCSGLGVLGRRPDARWQKNEDTIQQLAALSRQILENASRYVKRNGYLLYSTCTLTHEENQDNISAFLRDNPGFHLEPLPALPPSWQAQGAAMWQIWPHKAQTDGFFMALLKRQV